MLPWYLDLLGEWGIHECVYLTVYSAHTRSDGGKGWEVTSAGRVELGGPLHMPWYWELHVGPQGVAVCPQSIRDSEVRKKLLSVMKQLPAYYCERKGDLNHKTGLVV